MAGESDGGEERWSVETVRELLADPLYVGLGPFPRVISDDVWVESQVRRAETEGAASAVGLVLENFAAWFGGETPGRCRELVEGASSYVEEARADPEGAFRRLLADLHAAAEGTTTGKILKEWSSSQSGEESG